MCCGVVACYAAGVGRAIVKRDFDAPADERGGRKAQGHVQAAAAGGTQRERSGCTTRSQGGHPPGRGMHPPGCPGDTHGLLGMQEALAHAKGRMHWAASFPAQSNQVPRSRVEVRRSTRPLGSLLGAFLARSLPHGHRAAVELASTVQIAAMAGVCGTRMKGLLTCIRQSRNSCSNCTEVGCSVKTSKSRAKYSEAQRMTACTRLLPMYK